MSITHNCQSSDHDIKVEKYYLCIDHNIYRGRLFIKSIILKNLVNIEIFAVNFNGAFNP